LGLFNQKSARALAPRGLLQSAYVFLFFIYTKCSRAPWNVPGQFLPKPSEAMVAPFSIQKPSQKHQNLTSVLTIQKPIFSVPNTEFEGGDDGHGHGDCTFLVKQAQPSHVACALFTPQSACKITQKGAKRRRRRRGGRF
jgi:hypothetical protein